jgi:6-phosphofructokinase 1
MTHSVSTEHVCFLILDCFFVTRARANVRAYAGFRDVERLRRYRTSSMSVRIATATPCRATTTTTRATTRGSVRRPNRQRSEGVFARVSSGETSRTAETNEDEEDEEVDDAFYTWRVGGANDLKITHLRDVYKGNAPLEPSPSPFCTKSACPLNVGPRTSLAFNSNFVSNSDRILLNSVAFGSATDPSQTCSLAADAYNPQGCDYIPEWVVRAGPRAEVYFKSEEVNAAIVTCGGLCPGINDVIRSIVNTLEVGYGVKKISGVRYGFKGFFSGDPFMQLNRKNVRNIHNTGGSVLGSGRGGGDVQKIVESIIDNGINMVFVIGGNGTHAGANAISDECAKRGVKVSVVGVPKTIDNDILLLDKTFGFDTAVEEAQKAIQAAAIEAQSAHRGVGVVKLMGRQSGFIAMFATLANGFVDCCLIPEIDWAAHGPNGVIEYVRNTLDAQGHAVVVLAEGAGQEYVTTSGTDAGGNPKLGDIGQWFCKQLKAELKCDVKYIDPTYMVRGCVANAHDSIMCTVLGQNAVHGAFAGFTGISIGSVSAHTAFLPIPRMIERERLVDPDGRMWHRTLASTGQPDFF